MRMFFFGGEKEGVKNATIKNQSHLEVFPAMQFWLLFFLRIFWGSEDSNEKQESNMKQQIFSVLLRDLLCSSNLIMFPSFQGS